MSDFVIKLNNFENNYIKDKGAKELALALKDFKLLNHLEISLRNNNI